MRVQSQIGPYPEAYQTDTLPKSRGEGKENIDGGIKPLCPLVIGVSRLIELVDLFLKDGENCAGGIAGLELCGEWVCKKVVFCTLFICFQGVIEDLLEVRRRGGSILRVSGRHRWKCDDLFAMRDDRTLLG